ncbi:MAG: hypothetical protein V4496_02675 [Pseudomonadota bacterium]
MRWFFASLILMPTVLFAKQLVLNIPTTYPLNVINTQILCSSLHANLSTDALSKLETLSNVPFTCKQNPDDATQLMIIFTLKE